MKRLLFVAGACVLFSFTSIAAAQQGVTMLPSGNITVNMHDTQTYKIVRAIADKLGDEVVFRDLPAEKISADFEDISSNAVLDAILNEQGFGFDEDKIGKTISVTRKTHAVGPQTQKTGSMALQQPMSQPLAFSPPVQPRVSYHYFPDLVPDGYTGGPTWLDQAVEADRAQQTVRDLYIANRFAYQPAVSIQPPYYAGANNYYGGGFPIIYPWMKGCMNGVPGYIKFKYVGKSTERILWQVYLNGEIVGSLDQGDSFFNKIHVCAGHNMVVVEKLVPGKPRMERPYSVRPGDLTEITVGDFLLNYEAPKPK